MLGGSFLKKIALMLWISFFGCHKTSSDTPSSSRATLEGGSTAKQSILASTLTVEAQSISESTTSTSTDSPPNVATDHTDAGSLASNSQTGSQTGTKIGSSVAAYSNQLDFFRVPTVAPTDSSLASNPIQDYRDYTDLAIGPDATCVITGTTGSVVCPSYVSFMLFTDPWKKNPYIPGSLTIGNNHACAKSTLDSTYYCWGSWTNTTTNIATDGTQFWDSALSCTNNLFQYVESVVSDTSNYKVGDITNSKFGTFSFCKASRKAKGTHFLSTGDIDCEIVNNLPVCTGPVNPYKSNTVTTFYHSSIFSNLDNSITNSCVLHDDFSVTCSNSTTGTFSAYKPIWGTSNIYATQVAAGENMGCAYVNGTVGTTNPVSQLGCWKLPSTTMVPMQNSTGYAATGTIKVYRNLVCAQQGTTIRCWSPTEGYEYKNIPFPAVISTFSVGNGYVCTLDQEGKSGCWQADSGAPLNNDRKP